LFFQILNLYRYHKARLKRLINLSINDNKYINKVEVEKLERLDPELAKQEIHAHEAVDAYDAFRVKAGLYKFNSVDPQLESAWLQPLSLPLDPS
jgi:hypothetical protein